MWCIYGGTPLPEIKWRKQGGALPWGRSTYDNYGKTLVIKHVDFEDGGDYTCEASNGVGIAKSYSINLEILAKPRFTVKPQIGNKEKYRLEDVQMNSRCVHTYLYVSLSL